MQDKITVFIPAYNNDRTVEYAVKSAMAQNYEHKRIVVVDDGSSDDTVKVARRCGARIVKNKENLGIGNNLEKCFKLCKTNYLVFLCADDIFADENVLKDIVNIFHSKEKVGVIDRNYYQFMNGRKDPVTSFSNDNIFISSCNPSGMAFRKIGSEIKGTNRIFIEMPTIVKQYLRAGWDWTKIEYDTIAVRLHRGGNTGTKETYYKESPVKVWSEFVGPGFKYHPGLIQLKNCAPKMVFPEIINIVKINRLNLFDISFWACSAIALFVPRFILIKLSDWYRVNVSALSCEIKKRDKILMEGK